MNNTKVFSISLHCMKKHCYTLKNVFDTMQSSADLSACLRQERAVFLHEHSQMYARQGYMLVFVLHNRCCEKSATSSESWRGNFEKLFFISHLHRDTSGNMKKIFHQLVERLFFYLNQFRFLCRVKNFFMKNCFFNKHLTQIILLTRM